MRPSYVNTIFVATHPDRNEVILNLSHEYPDSSLACEQEGEIPVVTEQIASVVLSIECAENLCEILKDILNKQKAQ